MQWKHQRKYTTTLDLALQPDFPAMRKSNFLHHRQSDTGALDVRVNGRTAADKLAEDRLLLRGRNANAAIGDAYRRVIVFRLPLHPHRQIVRRILECVVDQIS